MKRSKAQTVKVYTPPEPSAFNAPMGASNLNMARRVVSSLPEEMRYFGWTVPTGVRTDSPWPDANFTPIRAMTEVLPGFFLFNLQSDAPGFRELNEISLVIKTPKGSVLVVGCSHPGIESIVEAATKIDPRIYSVFGGFHLSDTPDEEVTRLVTALRDEWKIERLAAGHCSGHFAFAEMIRIFGASYDMAGVGSVISTSKILKQYLPIHLPIPENWRTSVWGARFLACQAGGNWGVREPEGTTSGPRGTGRDSTLGDQAAH